jgi:hypothetical protein
MKQSAVRSSVCLALAGLLAGCVNIDFREPVGSFTTAMSTANAAVRHYFVEMNDFERGVYLQRALYDPSLAIDVLGADGKNTGLMPLFSAESIQARTDALALLTVYGERLAALAGADSPSRFAAGSKILGDNLSNLADTFKKLENPDAGDSSAGKYVGPISTVIGVLGEMMLDAQRDAALKRAVNEGAPAVDQILNQLEKDLELVVEPLRVTGQLQQLAAVRKHYNANRATMTFAERRQALADIDEAARRYQLAVTANPSEAIDGIRDAHAALVTYANSKHEPADLAALVSAIETFNNRLRPIIESLRALEEANDA